MAFREKQGREDEELAAMKLQLQQQAELLQQLKSKGTSSQQEIMAKNILDQLIAAQARGTGKEKRFNLIEN